MAASRVLQQFQFKDDKGPDSEVPEAVRPLQTEFKHGVRDFILQLLNDPGLSSTQAVELAARTALRQADAIPAPHEGPIMVGSAEYKQLVRQPYGKIVRLRIEQPKEHPDLVAVVTAIGIPCDSDSSFYLFRRTGMQWRLTLQQEENDYSDVTGARTAINYAISPSDANGEWYAVIADMNAACWSNWQSVRYNVVRPLEGSTSGRVLLSRHETIFEDEGPKLTVERDWFRLSWVANSIDSDVLTRVHVVQYAIGGDSTVRVPPYALRPQDFIDEWMSLPWEEAGRWTSTTNRYTAQIWHARLHRWDPAPEEWEQIEESPHAETPAKADEDYLEGSPRELFDFVQPCPQPNTWQIGLDIEGAAFPPQLFFSVSRKQDGYFIDYVGPTRPRGCPGHSRSAIEEKLPKLP